MKDIEECARSLLELLEAMGEVGVIVYTDGEMMPVMCQRESDLKPMLQRALLGLERNESRVLH